MDKQKKAIAAKINEALGASAGSARAKVRASDLVYPPDPDFGDLGLPCFDQNKYGADLAPLLAGLGDVRGIKSVKVAGGRYLNVTLDDKALARAVLREISEQGEKYGRQEPGRGKRVMVEFSNVNTHKEYHIGHLRNIAFGDAVCRLLRASGQEAIPVSYVNDFGIHTAKTLWALSEFYAGQQPKERAGEFLGQVYVRASRELKDNPAGQRIVEGIMKKIESREGREYEEWQKTRQWSIDQFNRIYEELGVEFDRIFYESEFIEAGRKRVNQLLKDGILQASQGAVIADLEKYKLGVLVILRSDGTAMYPVADLPLAEAKFKEYKLDASIYVVDNRQSLYFRQLFKILELMGHEQEKIHLKYDFVKLPQGAMSSRSGNVVTYAELKREMVKRAREETRKRHKDWPDKDVNETARQLALSTMKFEMLKVGAGQEIVFDPDKSLEFTGYTAGYILYTYARIKSILRKDRESGLNNKEAEEKKIDYSALNQPLEHRLLMRLARFKEAAAAAAAQYDPSQLAKYLFELAQAVNDYYHQVPIINSEDRERLARLALASAIARVLENGLEMLGIGVLERM